MIYTSPKSRTARLLAAAMSLAVLAAPTRAAEEATPEEKPAEQPAEKKPAEKKERPAPPDPLTTNPGKLPAFPGAEGFGALATGGRGRPVVYVTNLNDGGPGSLREAVSQEGRTVVFEVGGVIELQSPLSVKSHITIAGQTAPAPGITLYGDAVSFSNSQNIVVRHIRMRQGIESGRGKKALNVSEGHNMVFDHVTAAWGRWDTMGITSNSTNITLQDCIMSEAIDPQRFGGIIDSSHGITVTRTLWSNNQNRNPKIKAHMQYFNNVIYNWGSGGLPGGHSSADWYQDIINNVFIAGPTSKPEKVVVQFAKTDNVHQRGNIADVDKDGQLNGRELSESDYKGDTPPTFHAEPHNHPPIPTRILETTEALEHVLANAGASLWRDAHDERLISEVRTLGKAGKVIKTEAEVGGQPAIEPTRHPDGHDTDRDGMADAWEQSEGLDPRDPSDAQRGEGYTNLERYINGLAEPARKTF